MQNLFGKIIATISEHIKNVLEEGELDKDSVVRNFLTTTQQVALSGKINEDNVAL